MPFKAIDKNGEKQVSYLLLPNQYHQEWICPACSQPLSFIDATLKRKHFRHRVESFCESEPETEEHISLKEWVYSWLSGGGFRCEYEVKIGNRVADITFTKEHSKKLWVVECQISPISSSEILQRSSDYLCNQVSQVFWIMYPGNYLELYSNYKIIYRLKEVERGCLDSPHFLYFDPINKQVKKYFFIPKWMKGGGTCESIYLRKDEFVIENKWLTNWGMTENWIEGRLRFHKVKRRFVG